MKQFEAKLAWQPELKAIHPDAHERCCIANSLRAEVVVEAEA